MRYCPTYALAAILSIALTALKADSIPHDTYVIMSANGWTMHVYQDGAADILALNVTMCEATAPAGTLDYAQIRRNIESQSQGKGILRGGIQLSGQPFNMRPIGDAGIWNDAVAQLSGKLTSMMPDIMEKVLKTRPIAIPINDRISRDKNDQIDDKKPDLGTIKSAREAIEEREINKELAKNRTDGTDAQGSIMPASASSKSAAGAEKVVQVDRASTAAPEKLPQISAPQAALPVSNLAQPTSHRINWSWVIAVGAVLSAALTALLIKRSRRQRKDHADENRRQ